MRQRHESRSDSSGVDPEAEALCESAELLAKILDHAIRIPRTNLYLGLDPLIGLVPGAGDLLASLIGAAILVMAVRLRAPRITLVRMCLNLLLNGVLGAVPGLGDVFSVWFQSNRRNAALLRRASAAPPRGRPHGLGFRGWPSDRHPGPADRCDPGRPLAGDGPVGSGSPVLTS